MGLGVDEEGRAAIACLGGQTPSSATPTLHHHVIQLFAQKPSQRLRARRFLNEVPGGACQQRRRDRVLPGLSRRRTVSGAPSHDCDTRSARRAALVTPRVRRAVGRMGAPCMLNDREPVCRVSRSVPISVSRRFTSASATESEAADCRSPCQDIRCAWPMLVPAARLHDPPPHHSLRPARYSCARYPEASAVMAWRRPLPLRRKYLFRGSARLVLARPSSSGTRAPSPAAVSRKLRCCARSSSMPAICKRVLSSSAVGSAMRASSSATR